MGILDRLRSATALASSPPALTGISSPWAETVEGTLSTIVAADIFGGDVDLPVTRAEAMTVPSVVKARHIIIGALAGLPLKAYRDGTELPPADQPTFLYRTNGASTPWHRQAWTIDDLIFYGWSLWWTDRGTSAGASGPILDAARIHPSRWRLDPHTRGILVDGEPVNADDVILFPGPSEGLLITAARTIRAAVDLERSWAGKVRNPVPIVELHQTTDDELTEEEIKTMVSTYAKARRDPDGAIVYTPFDIELKAHGTPDADMLIGARNAVRLDVANFTGLPAEALDGSLSTASLTYTTQEGTRTEIGDALKLWREPFQARLSQDDVVPRGQYVRLDAADINTATPANAGPITLD